MRHQYHSGDRRNNFIAPKPGSFDLRRSSKVLGDFRNRRLKQFQDTRSRACRGSRNLRYIVCGLVTPFIPLRRSQSRSRSYPAAVSRGHVVAPSDRVRSASIFGSRRDVSNRGNPADSR